VVVVGDDGTDDVDRPRFLLPLLLLLLLLLFVVVVVVVVVRVLCRLRGFDKELDMWW